MATPSNKLLHSRISLFRCSKLLPRISAGAVSAKNEPCGDRGFHSSDALKRKKAIWRMDRRPANTMLTHELPERIKERKAYGGHRKTKAVWINSGNFTLKSCDVSLQTPILRVVHSFANTTHVERQIIVKGTIVQIDESPFKSWCEKQIDASQQDTGADEKPPSQLIQKTKKILDAGQLLAKIDTRPGQVGACNGYILEGQELETLKKEINLTAVQ